MAALLRDRHPQEDDEVDARDGQRDADLNADGVLDNGDIQLFVTLFLAGDLAADMNGHILLTMLWTKLASNKKLISGVALDKPQHLQTLKDLAESGAIKPTIDRTYPFDEIQQAHAYVDAAHKSGSVVVTVLKDAIAEPEPGANPSQAG